MPTLNKHHQSIKYIFLYRGYDRYGRLSRQARERSLKARESSSKAQKLLRVNCKPTCGRNRAAALEKEKLSSTQRQTLARTPLAMTLSASTLRRRKTKDLNDCGGEESVHSDKSLMNMCSFSHREPICSLSLTARVLVSESLSLARPEAKNSELVHSVLLSRSPCSVVEIRKTVKSLAYSTPITSFCGGERESLRRLLWS